MEHRALAKVRKLRRQDRLNVLRFLGNQEPQLSGEANLNGVGRLLGGDIVERVEPLEELMSELILSNTQKDWDGFLVLVGW